MADDDPDDLEEFLLSLQADLRAMNLKLATLRELFQEHAGVTDAQYDAKYAEVAAAVQALIPDGRTQH